MACREFHGLSDPSAGRYRLVKNARRFPMARLRDYLHFRTHHDDYKIFAFVRNPYARVYSGWKDKFYDGHKGSDYGRLSGYPRSMRRGELKKARAYCRKHGLPGAAEGELVPFASFVRYMADQPPGGAQPALGTSRCLSCSSPSSGWRALTRSSMNLTRASGRSQKRWNSTLTGPLLSLAAKRMSRARYDGSAHPMTDEVAEEVFHACEPDFDVFGYDKGKLPGALVARAFVHFEPGGDEQVEGARGDLEPISRDASLFQECKRSACPLARLRHVGKGLEHPVKLAVIGQIDLGGRQQRHKAEI